jgi:hypothetical protein
MMKKIKIGLVAFFIAGLSLSVFAWQNRKFMTPAQEVAINSLANRYLESMCRRPSDIAEIFEGSIIPGSLLNKSKDFLQEQLYVEGECFGRPMAEMQKDIFNDLVRLPRELIKMKMTSEIAVGDFLDCLVEVEKSFYSLQIATRKIFHCIDNNLDVRGFWYEMINEIKPRTSQQSPDRYQPPYAPPGVPYDSSNPAFFHCVEKCGDRHHQIIDSTSSEEYYQCKDRCAELYQDIVPPIERISPIIIE